jgi:hypothetical protein
MRKMVKICQAAIEYKGTTVHLYSSGILGSLKAIL